MTRRLPPSASIAHEDEGAKLHAPSADRNAPALCEVIQKYAPSKGTALEIASGTGQHITAYARAMPHLHWHPTEIDAQRRASIDAYTTQASLTNVAAAEHLNAVTPGWGNLSDAKNMIVLANLLHLISQPETEILLQESINALASGGILVLYGPYKRDGVLISDGDVRFDSELRAADPEIGYKDVGMITAFLQNAGQEVIATETMPANNLALVSRKPTP